MFVDDPRLEAAREFIAPEAGVAINRVLSGIRTHEMHPTFITKTSIKEDVVAMKTVFDLLCRADGYRGPGESAIDPELQVRYDEALDHARTTGYAK